MEYLEVYVPEEQELMPEESKDPHKSSFKSQTSTSDSDSGRGSCDSRTLLVDKSEEDEKMGPQSNQCGQTEIDLKRPEESSEEIFLAYSHGSVGSPDTSSEKVKTWPSLFSSLTENSSGPLDQPDSPDCLFSPGPLSSHFSPPGHKPVLGSNYQEFSFGKTQPHALHHQAGTHQYLQAYSDVSDANFANKEAPAGFRLASVRSTEYVEVQRVKNDNMVLLHPVPSDPEQGCPERRHTEEYSKVKGVNNDNRLLLLQRKSSDIEMDICPYEDQQMSEPADSGYTASIATVLQKTPAYIHPATQILDERAAGGYVDTSVFPLPTY